MPEQMLVWEKLPDLPEAICIHPEGPLDADHLDAINSGVLSVLNDHDRFIFLDFSRIDDLEAAGVGLLVALQKKMRARGGDIVLYGMRPKLQHFLELLGFRSFFSIALDLQYALEYIEGMKRDIFPVAVICPACSSALGIEKPGRGRCRACNAVITVLPDGSVELG